MSHKPRPLAAGHAPSPYARQKPRPLAPLPLAAANVLQGRCTHPATRWIPSPNISQMTTPSSTTSHAYSTAWPRPSCYGAPHRSSGPSTSRAPTAVRRPRPPVASHAHPSPGKPTRHQPRPPFDSHAHQSPVTPTRRQPRPPPAASHAHPSPATPTRRQPRPPVASHAHHCFKSPSASHALYHPPRPLAADTPTSASPATPPARQRVIEHNPRPPPLATPHHYWPRPSPHTPTCSPSHPRSRAKLSITRLQRCSRREFCTLTGGSLV
ncbi:extensin-like [Amblyraja radiata]|uniref:extensin-like n=1 Tax=Amblyraja radiata TaxID=386614 RepID=UPI0014040701|nr:extensin-like [Amblyraja radiata]